MSVTRVTITTALAMLAFASNSLLCRLALNETSIDAASFTTLRLAAGAVTLWLIVLFRHRSASLVSGNWKSAFALFFYAAGFSYAYLQLPTAAGALLLFSSVQVTMIGYGMWNGERLQRLQFLGVFFSLGGLVILLFPGLSAPPLPASVLMLMAGVASGIYSLLGKSTTDPLGATAGNFLRSIPIALALSILMQKDLALDSAGIIYAVISGALASGIGYAIWYTALRGLSTATASIVQLTVPIIAAFGGALFLNEAITGRLILATIITLSGILLVILKKKRLA